MYFLLFILSVFMSYVQSLSNFYHFHHFIFFFIAFIYMFENIYLLPETWEVFILSCTSVYNHRAFILKGSGWVCISWHNYLTLAVPLLTVSTAACSGISPCCPRTFCSVRPGAVVAVFTRVLAGLCSLRLTVIPSGGNWSCRCGRLHRHGQRR